MRACDRCRKGIQVGMNVSHSHIRTKKRSLPNLHAFKVKTGATVRRLSLCTKCLRIVKKEQTLLAERLSKKVVNKFSPKAENKSAGRWTAKPEKKSSEKSTEDINIENDLIAAK